MTQTNLEKMIAEMEQAVEEGLAYLEDTGGGTSPQVDRWTAKEVLAHMVYWHRASLQGIESVSNGGPPFQVPDTSDVINDEIVDELSETSVSSMAEELRDLQKRLSAAAGPCPTLTIPSLFESVDRPSLPASASKPSRITGETTSVSCKRPHLHHLDQHHPMR